MSLRATRYRQLVDRLGRELGGGRGWKSEAARLLAVHPSFISKVAAGSVTKVRQDLADRALEELGLPAGFFDDPTLDVDAVPLRRALALAPPLAERGLVRWQSVDEVAREVQSGARIVAGEGGAFHVEVPQHTSVQLAQLVLELPVIRLAREVAAGNATSSEALLLALQSLVLAQAVFDADQRARELLDRESIAGVSVLDEIRYAEASAQRNKDA